MTGIADWCIDRLVRSTLPPVELPSIDPCPSDRYVRAFSHSDKLQSHFKVHRAQQKDSTQTQLPDDLVQKAISMGMLILPPVEQTPQLLRDAGLVVLDIADGIRLLLCKVCNVCLEPKPC
jgi:hypothetical protein